MERIAVFGFTLSLTLVWPGQANFAEPPPSKNKPDPAESARNLVTQFMKAMQLRNLDDIMTMVDVPWCHDMKTTIYDRKELELDFHRLLEKHRNRPTMQYDVRPAYAYADVREKLPDQERKDIDKVIRPTDYIVLVYVKTPAPAAQTEQEIVVFFVRHRNNEFTVVGLKNRNNER